MIYYSWPNRSLEAREAAAATTRALRDSESCKRAVASNAGASSTLARRLIEREIRVPVEHEGIRAGEAAAASIASRRVSCLFRDEKIFRKLNKSEPLGQRVARSLLKQNTY